MPRQPVGRGQEAVSKQKGNTQRPENAAQPMEEASDGFSSKQLGKIPAKTLSR